MIDHSQNGERKSVSEESTYLRRAASMKKICFNSLNSSLVKLVNFPIKVGIVPVSMLSPIIVNIRAESVRILTKDRSKIPAPTVKTYASLERSILSLIQFQLGWNQLIGFGLRDNTRKNNETTMNHDNRTQQCCIDVPKSRFSNLPTRDLVKISVGISPPNRFSPEYSQHQAKRMS